MTGCCVVETQFNVLFPSYLEAHIKAMWNDVTKALKKNELKGILNLIEGSMTVRTTIKTSDPICILNGRDFLRLIARSVPLSQAEKVFVDDVTSDIINIGNMVTNTQRFVKRRERLVGPNGQTLRTLEILSGCYILIQGKSVAIIGSEPGVKKAGKVVRDCMRNIHPVYGLKRLMILKELESNPAMTGKDWSKFLPQYSKSHQRKRSKSSALGNGQNKNKCLFPNLPKQRKEDVAVETGEIFLGKR